MFSFEFCDISKNTFSHRKHLVAASDFFSPYDKITRTVTYTSIYPIQTIRKSVKSTKYKTKSTKFDKKKMNAASEKDHVDVLISKIALNSFEIVYKKTDEWYIA